MAQDFCRAGRGVERRPVEVVHLDDDYKGFQE